MNSSAKFFVPTVIAGFGPAAADDVEVVFLLLPPQAVSPIRSATPNETANAALAARRVCLRNIRALLSRLSLAGTLRLRCHPTRGRALCECERGGGEDLEGGDPERRARMFRK